MKKFSPQEEDEEVNQQEGVQKRETKLTYVNQGIELTWLNKLLIVYHNSNLDLNSWKKLSYKLKRYQMIFSIGPSTEATNETNDNSH